MRRRKFESEKRLTMATNDEGGLRGVARQAAELALRERSAKTLGLFL